MMEEVYIECFFEEVYLLVDCCLGYVEFGCCVGEVVEVGDCFEFDQCGQ